MIWKIIMKNLKRIFLLMLLLVTLIACNKKPSGNKKSDLTGHITFLTSVGEEFSNNTATATVKLYLPNPSADSLRMYKNDYPFVGSSINPILISDYRTLGEPIYSTTTNSDGDFTLTNINNGEYLFVYSSDNFGWHTKALIIDSNININLSMREKIEISSTINENMTLGPDAYVEISSNIGILSSAEVKILNNTVLTLNNTKISVMGSLNVEGLSTEPVIFTSSQNSPESGDWSGIELTTSSISSIGNAIFQWSSTPITCLSHSEIDNIIIANSKVNAIYCENTSANMKNITFYANNQSCYFSNVNTTSLQNNINKSLFMNTSHKAIYLLTSSPILTNSIFKKSDIHIDAYWDSFPTISNCSFDNSDTYAITSSKQYDTIHNMIIKYNDFNDDNTLFFFNRGSYSNFTNNNFSCSDGYIFLLHFYYNGNIVNAQRNWWGTTNETEIQNLIWDETDDPGGDNLGTVDYSHWKSNKISGTGPQNN